MADGPAWPGRLAEALAEGLPGPVVAERLDALLRWMSDPQGEEARALADAIAQRGLQTADARQAAFALLDHVLFSASDDEPHRVLGLRPGTDAKGVQARYHRLVQLYHPDRNQGDRGWLTERTERLNRAYSRLKRGGSAAPNGAAAAPPPAGVHVTAAYPRTAYPRETVDLRRHLGSARQLRRRILIGLAAASLALLGYLYFVNAPYRQPQDVASAPEAGEKAPETLVAAADPPSTQTPPTAAADGEAAGARASAAGVGTQPDDPAAKDRQESTAERAKESQPPAAEAVAAEPERKVDANAQAAPVSAPTPASEPQGVQGADAGSAPPADAESVTPARQPPPAVVVSESRGDGPRQGAAATEQDEAGASATSAGETLAARQDTGGEGASEPASSTQEPPVAAPAPPPVAKVPPAKPSTAQPKPHAAERPPAPKDGAPPRSKTADAAATPKPQPAPVPAVTPAMRRQAEDKVAAYVVAFERADAQAFARLFADPVRVAGNERDAQAAAREIAARLDNSVQRAMDTATVQLSALSDGAARATVVYDESVMYADGRGSNARGTLVLTLEPGAGGLRIAAVDHRDVERRDTGAVDAIRALLDRYCDLYAAGDLQGFVGLFTADGVDNTVHGRGGLLDEYRTLFDSTRTRALRLDTNEISTADGKEFRVTGSYTVSLTYRNGRTFEATAPIQIVVVERREGMKIERMKY